MTRTWQPPTDYGKRPVTILGAGVLGRRIGKQSTFDEQRHDANIVRIF